MKYAATLSARKNSEEEERRRRRTSRKREKKRTDKIVHYTIKQTAVHNIMATKRGN